MKKFLVFVGLALAAVMVNGQGCLPQGITFTTQEQIDNFQANYPGCTEIEGGVTIEGWDYTITNLNGLNVLTSIGGSLVIVGCEYLTDLTGLESLTSIEGDLYIIYNPSLATCDIQVLCNYLLNPSGSINIYHNAQGCENPPEVAANCGFTMPCMPFGNYYFYNQADIDNFQINYPGCTEIQGNILIGYNSNITNLTALSVLTSVGGGLEIKLNDALTSLTGLEYLTSIGGYLYIIQNPALSSLTGLNNLTSIGNDFAITTNFSLASLAELEGLTSIGSNLTISFNNSLTNLTGLEGLTSIDSDFLITNNPALISLSGIDSITFIGGTLKIMGNNTLTNLSGFENLTYAGNLSIWADHALTMLSGLENLDSIGGYLAIGDNPAIDNISGLESLKTVGGLMNIYHNTALTSLTGLESLNYIGGFLNIESNNALISLSGLAGINSIGGDLRIYYNTSLISLSGIMNIDPGSIMDLTIKYNYGLSQCDVNSICNYLASPNGTIEIHDNAPGCNSQTEVAAHCLTGMEENQSPVLSIIPNPAKDRVTVAVPSSGNKVIDVFNTKGEKVIDREFMGSEIGFDVSGLPKGVYFVRVQDEKGVMVEKFVKE